MQDMRKRSRKILIVDDEPYNIFALKIIIKSICDEDLKEMVDELVDQAPNGQVACDMVKMAHE